MSHVYDMLHEFIVVTVLAESSVVPRAISDLDGIGSHMHVLAFFIVALSKLLEEVTDWHFGHVILVQELAVISFLAQLTQPMFAYHDTFTTDVSERAVSTSDARPHQVQLTQRSLVLCVYTRTSTHIHIITWDKMQPNLYPNKNEMLHV